ncbi:MULTISPECIES: hypothetical protein [unclassified Marinovum]
MRRNDTSIIGDMGEAEALSLLQGRGYKCENLNDKRRNAWTYDLEIGTARGKFLVSVKTARAKRDISLGRPLSLKRLENDAFMMILMPSGKNQETRFEPGGYHLLILPGQVARDEALSSHYHYWGNDSEKAENNTVRIKDKLDRPGGRSNSGEVFSSWNDRFRDAWHLLPEP